MPTEVKIEGSLATFWFDEDGNLRTVRVATAGVISLVSAILTALAAAGVI